MRKSLVCTGWRNNLPPGKPALWAVLEKGEGVLCAHKIFSGWRSVLWEKQCSYFTEEGCDREAAALHRLFFSPLAKSWGHSPLECE